MTKKILYCSTVILVEWQAWNIYDGIYCSTLLSKVTVILMQYWSFKFIFFFVVLQFLNSPNALMAPQGTNSPRTDIGAEGGGGRNRVSQELRPAVENKLFQNDK